LSIASCATTFAIPVRVVVPKGARIDATVATTLLGVPWDEIHVLALDPGDVHEEEAGERLAAAVVGDGVEVKSYSGGQWTLTATRRGLLRIDESLTDINAREGISVFTLFNGQPVEVAEAVAKAKVTPLAIPEQTIVGIEAQARAAGGVVGVTAFKPTTVGAVARESLDARQRARFEAH
jgi:hypothetical protein